MRPRKVVEKTIRTKLHFTFDPPLRDRLLARAMHEQEQSQDTEPALAGPVIRRTIMRSPSMKWAAAAVVVAAVGTGLIGIWHKGGQAAYAFAQTVEAMQGKRSFHIQTYHQQRRHDEFWAEFDEQGRLLRFRQKEGNGPEGSLVTFWEDGIRNQHLSPPSGIRLIQRLDNTDGGLEGLEQFDPETIVQEIQALVDEGKAIMEVQDPPPFAKLKTIRVTCTDGKALKRILVVDPVTKFVVRIDDYWGREGEGLTHKGIEVLEYNEAMDPRLFKPDCPEDTIVIDQVSQEVGMAQGQMTDQEAAVATLREALSALEKEDYTSACKLCGGVPRGFLIEHFGRLRPASAVTFDSPEYVQNVLPVYRVKCTYEVERDGQMETINPVFIVREACGQPGRWYVTWHVFPGEGTGSSDED